MSIPSWYCVITGINCELKAQRGLTALGYETYMPRTRKIVKHARKIELKVYPLFSRYIFVKFDIQNQEWSSPIRSADGIVDIICNNYIPVSIPDWIIEEIKRREESGEFSQKVPPKKYKWKKSFDHLRELFSNA